MFASSFRSFAGERISSGQHFLPSLFRQTRHSPLSESDNAMIADHWLRCWLLAFVRTGRISPEPNWPQRIGFKVTRLIKNSIERWSTGKVWLVYLSMQDIAFTVDLLDQLMSAELVTHLKKQHQSLSVLFFKKQQSITRRICQIERESVKYLSSRISEMDCE